MISCDANRKRTKSRVQQKPGEPYSLTRKILMGLFLLWCALCVFASADDVSRLASEFNLVAKHLGRERSKLKVAIGVNVCADLIVRASDLLKQRPSLAKFAEKKDLPVLNRFETKKNS